MIIRNAETGFKFLQMHLKSTFKVFWLIIILLSYKAESSAQVTSKTFRNTSWAFQITDNIFKGVDTLKLLQVLSHDNDEGPRKESLDQFFHQENYGFLSFRKRKFTIELYNIENWTVSKLKNKFSWKFDETRNYLELCDNNEVCAIYLFLISKNVSIPSNYANEVPIKSIELIFVRGR